MPHPIADIVSMVQRQVAEMGQIGATNIVKVPDLDAVMAVAPSALVATEVAATPLVFLESGWVIAMYGSERSGLQAKKASTELRLTINGVRELVTYGTRGPAFAAFDALFGANMNWFSLMRRVAKDEVWHARYRNFDTVATAIPSLMFAFLSDVQAEKMARRERV
ncbi:MAG: hypothetical protein WKG32_20930 [Gemmatimonadaceae bacterium]